MRPISQSAGSGGLDGVEGHCPRLSFTIPQEEDRACRQDGHQHVKLNRVHDRTYDPDRLRRPLRLSRPRRSVGVQGEGNLPLQNILAVLQGKNRVKIFLNARHLHCLRSAAAQWETGNGSFVFQMALRMTASSRATATFSFLKPAPLALRRPQAFREERPTCRVRMALAAS